MGISQAVTNSFIDFFEIVSHKKNNTDLISLSSPIPRSVAGPRPSISSILFNKTEICKREIKIPGILEYFRDIPRSSGFSELVDTLLSNISTRPTLYTSNIMQTFDSILQVVFIVII